MAECILVALKETAAINQFMPYLKMTAQPGHTLIFLVRTATSNWGGVESHLPMVETGNITAREYRENAWRFNIERERERAERELASACEALRRKGINAEVKIYAGGLSKALRECTRAGPTRLIILPADYPFFKMFKTFFAALNLFPHHNVPPVTFLPPSYSESNMAR